MPGQFTVLPVDPTLTLSNERTAQLLREVLAVAETSELIEPSQGDLYLSDPESAAGLVAYVTPPAAPKRRVSRSVCVPIRVEKDRAVIVPGSTRENGSSELPARGAMCAALARATGARLIVHTEGGWILDHVVTVHQETEAGSVHEADAIIAAIEKARGASGRSTFRGVVKMAGDGYFMFVQNPYDEFLNDYATMRLAVQEHLERLRFEMPARTRFAAIWRGDTQIIGMVALHDDGAVSPYILSDYRGGVGVELARLLWDRKRSVVTPTGSDVERFYHQCGFKKSGDAQTDSKMIHLAPPTVHGDYHAATTAVLVAPCARKVLMGIRVHDARAFPDHWDLGTCFADGGADTTFEETLSGQGVSVSDGLAPRNLSEHFSAWGDTVFRIASAFFVLDQDREERYLAREWFSRTDEYTHLQWVDIGDAYTRRPMSLATRALLRRAMKYMKPVTH